MARLHLDFDTPLGNIKPMHGVGQPPFVGLSDELMHYIEEAGIPYARLHDVGGAYGRNQFVDIPNIFRDFDADENDPTAYDFGFTDWLIGELMKRGCEPIYRLGVSIENQQNIKAYRIYPPKDFHKWARVCEHIIRHYTCGWANGFLYDITYWEIWNEPELGAEAHNNQMWKGTAEEFFELYEITAKHLKKCFPEIKVGGYGCCGFWSLFMEEDAYYNADLIESSVVLPKNSWRKSKNRERAYRMEFFDRFLRHMKDANAPIDFFSWHSYDTIEHTVRMANYAQRKLLEYGFTHTEHQLNEWNTARGDHAGLGKRRYAAETLGMMCALHRTSTALLAYYDARCSADAYSGLFNPLTYAPFCAYYAFGFFNALYRLGSEVVCELEEAPGVYALAASGDAGHAFVVANTHEMPIRLTLTGLPLGERKASLVSETCGVQPFSFDAGSSELYIEGYACLLVEFKG